MMKKEIKHFDETFVIVVEAFSEGAFIVDAVPTSVMSFKIRLLKQVKDDDKSLVSLSRLMSNQFDLLSNITRLEKTIETLHTPAIKGVHGQLLAKGFTGSLDEGK